MVNIICMQKFNAQPLFHECFRSERCFRSQNINTYYFNYLKLHFELQTNFTNARRSFLKYKLHYLCVYLCIYIYICMHLSFVNSLCLTFVTCTPCLYFDMKAFTSTEKHNGNNENILYHKDLKCLAKRMFA